MAKFTIREVTTHSDAREFLMLPVRLYRNEKNWIRPLDKDVESVFDRKKNKLFRKGDAIRWIAADENGITIGRVAAFFDRRSSAGNKQPTGSMGFFEVENDRELAFALFDKCREWLKEKGMEAMDGPINFGDRDRWWGLLVEGSDPPNYCMPWNFSWYRTLFEDYGFRNYYNQYTYRKPVTIEGVDPVILEKAARITKDPDYRFRHVTRATFHKVPYDFMVIYNKAWASFSGNRGATEAQARLVFRSLKPVIDYRLLWFGYYRAEPICFFLMLPEINPIIRHLNGKMNLIGKLKFLIYRYILRSAHRAFGLIFGVVPEHRKKGVEGALIAEFGKLALKPSFPYRELEFNWIGDFNPSMMHLLEQIGAKIVKTHITYRFLFDRNAPFERAGRVNI
jgi:GNAT superfamily N-acetyltransferase